MSIHPRIRPVEPRAPGELARSVIDAARAAGYSRVLLDTLPKMDAALALYRSLGFRPAGRYYDNPLPDATYLSLDLAADARK